MSEIPAYLYLLNEETMHSPLVTLYSLQKLSTHIPSAQALDDILNLVSYSNCLPVVHLALTKLTTLIETFGGYCPLILDEARVKLAAAGSLNAMILTFLRYSNDTSIISKVMQVIEINE